MAQISLVIDDELDAKFRAEIAKRLGMKKGHIKIAIEEAIQLWIDHHKA
jgi:hypothetical protein